MITERSQQLRDLLHTGEVVCHCSVDLKFDLGEDGHGVDCLWIEAVKAVYEEERGAGGNSIIPEMASKSDRG